MIVRDEETNISKCLSSVAGLFDEIVVVDTGSTDRTRGDCPGVRARVFDFVWVDDFAAARNAALARAKGDYAFWLDADDVVDPPERERIKALLGGLRPGDDAAYVSGARAIRSPTATAGRRSSTISGCSLCDRMCRWTYRVHEQILPALRRANVPVRWTDVTVRHTGYSDPALRERKLQRDEKILQDDLAARPGEPFVLFNSGARSPSSARTGQGRSTTCGRA